jgi:hypothetical protein
VRAHTYPDSTPFAARAEQAKVRGDPERGRCDTTKPDAGDGRAASVVSSRLVFAIRRVNLRARGTRSQSEEEAL